MADPLPPVDSQRSTRGAVRRREQPPYVHDVPEHLQPVVVAVLMLLASVPPRGFERSDPKPRMVIDRPRVEHLLRATNKALPGALQEVREMAREKGWSP